MLLNKKGQVGDGISWMVATILVVVILLFFIFGSSLLASTKSSGSKSSLGEEDIFLKKSLFTVYSGKISENNQKALEKKLNESVKKGDFDSEFYEKSKKEITRNLK